MRKSNNSNVLYPIPAPSYHAGLDRNVWQAELDKVFHSIIKLMLTHLFN